MSCFREPPAMQRYTSLATSFKTCSKRCFRKLVLCKNKNPHNSPSWRASSVLHAFFPVHFHAPASAHSTNHTYISGAQFLFCLMPMIDQSDLTSLDLSETLSRDEYLCFCPAFSLSHCLLSLRMLLSWERP